MLFIKIANSFTSLIPCPIPPTDDRENSDRTPKEDLMTKKALFLRLSPKKVDLIPEKVVSIPKKVVSHPKKVDSFPETVDLYSSPLHLTLYTLHQKNRTKMRFFLHIRKFYCTFASRTCAGDVCTSAAKGSRHNKRRLLALVLVDKI